MTDAAHVTSNAAEVEAMEWLEVCHAVSQAVGVGYPGDETLRIPGADPCGEGPPQGDVPELLL